MGMFPTSLKKTIIYPIFKSGPGNLATNYHPTAVLSALSKILERLINKRLTGYLKHKILSPKQFRFWKQKSTNDAIGDLVTYILQN